MGNKGIHHYIEKFSSLYIINIVLIATFAIDACSTSEINVQETPLYTNLSKNLSDNSTLLINSNHHTRAQTWGLFQHTEEVVTVKEGAFAKLGQIFTMCYNIGSNFHITYKVLLNVHRWVYKHYLQM